MALWLFIFAVGAYVAPWIEIGKEMEAVRTAVVGAYVASWI